MINRLATIAIVLLVTVSLIAMTFAFIHVSGGGGVPNHYIDKKIVTSIYIPDYGICGDIIE